MYAKKRSLKNLSLILTLLHIIIDIQIISDGYKKTGDFVTCKKFNLSVKIIFNLYLWKCLSLNFSSYSFMN